MKRILALVLALLCMLPLFAACKGEEVETPETTADTQAPEEDPIKQIQLSKNGKAVYTVVVPAASGSALRDAAQSLVSKIAKETGAIFKLIDDSTYAGNVIDGEYEILIGNCKRTDSQKALTGMAYKDYKITVTEKNVVIASRDEESTIAAIWKFITFMKEENFVRDEETKSLALVWGDDVFVANDSYVLDGFTLDGKSVKDFRIVYPSEGNEKRVYLSYAEELRDWIGSNTGYVLEIVPDSEPAADLEILLGKTSRAESTAYYEKYSLGLLQYAMCLKNGKLQLAGAMPFSTSKAIEAFKLRVTQNSGELATFDIGRQNLNTAYRGNVADYRVMQYNILVEYDGWGSGGQIVPEVEVRKELVASVILGYAPDVLVLCEVFDNWRAQLPPLLEDEYTYVEIDRLGTSNRTPIAYKTARFNLIKSGAESIVTYENINNRVVTWAVLEDKMTEERLIVFGTHYNSDGGDNGEADRTVQAQKTLEIIDRVMAQYPGTLILMGDFNTTNSETKTAYQTLASRYSNAFAGVPGNSVDHFFYDPTQIEIAEKVIETAHYTPFASDHKPIIADINLK